ncbi:hypothetical protein ACO1O0_003334 [Amphichorda felina]
MRASTILGLAALLKATAALPAANINDSNDGPEGPTITAAPLLPRQASPTAPWVLVDDETRPAKTLTPSYTTKDDGSTELVDAAPHDITASVFTSTYYGKVTTSTGKPPNPSATNKHGEGAFARCFNQDGENRPLCNPEPSSTLYKDSVYYITWDPDFFNKTETRGNGTVEVAVRLDYLNRTKTDDDDEDNGGVVVEKFVKLHETDRVPAEWGFLPLKINKKFIKGSSPHNITLTLMVADKGSSAINETSDAIPLFLEKRKVPEHESSHIEHEDLIIALPITVGVVLFLLIGIFLWNRKTRRIQIGNVMSRARHRVRRGRGYTGRKARKLFNRDAEAGAIRLGDRSQSPPLYEYSDHVVHDPPQRPRRDSDLGSLAGSPVTPTFQHQDTVGSSGNTFRDELRRQDELRKLHRH